MAEAVPPEKYELRGLTHEGYLGQYHIMLGLMMWHEETWDREAVACATRIVDFLCRKPLGRKKRVWSTQV